MMVGHFSPFFKHVSEWQSDSFILSLKTHQNDSRTFSSFLWKFVRMTVGHFPPFILKTCQNGCWAFSSFFHKCIRHWDLFLLISKKISEWLWNIFLLFCENLSERLWDIFHLFVKTCQNVRKCSIVNVYTVGI